MSDKPMYGLLAEFDTPGEVVDAARRTMKEGYKAVDAYSPFPIEDLTEALNIRRTRLPLFVLGLALFGACAGFFMQYFTAVIEYPLNIGGRPLNSWPQWIPITFEMAILFAASAGVIGMIMRNGLPKPYNPLFNVDRFEEASNDKFFICIESTDPKFNKEQTTKFLWSLKPSNVFEVDP